MSKRNDLKRRLKAADRRRNRRKASQSVPQDAANQGEPSLPQVNPADLIAEILVKYGREDKSPSDIAATAALRACLNGDVPSKEPARTLATTIESGALRAILCVLFWTHGRLRMDVAWRAAGVGPTSGRDCALAHLPSHRPGRECYWPKPARQS